MTIRQCIYTSAVAAVFLVAAVGVPAVDGEGGGIEELRQQAAQHYRDGNYQDAYQLYEGLL